MQPNEPFVQPDFAVVLTNLSLLFSDKPIIQVRKHSSFTPNRLTCIALRPSHIHQDVHILCTALFSALTARSVQPHESKLQPDVPNVQVSAPRLSPSPAYYMFWPAVRLLWRISCRVQCVCHFVHFFAGLP